MKPFFRDGSGDGTVPAARVLAMHGGDRVVVRDLVETLVRVAVEEGTVPADVRVVVDVPGSTVVDASRAGLQRILALLLERALAGARLGTGPCRPEVVVTGVVGPAAVEIEVAASGAGLDPADVAALRDRGAVRGSSWATEVAREAVFLGGTLLAVDCPEGGAAVTLVLPARRASLRRAA